MKALILATDIYTRGGIARHSYTFASALADLLGPENVHVLALLGGSDDFDQTPGNPVRFELGSLRTSQAYFRSVALRAAKASGKV